jgi:hypothetical protein
MTTTYKILTIAFLMTVFGCKNNTDSKKPVESQNENECKPYFNFDKVEHYFLDVDEDKIWKLEEKINKTEKESKQLELLIQYIPDKLSDTTYLKDLEKIDFVKTELSSDKFEQLNKIFCERKHKESIAMACIAVYRDILIFKKDNKTIGTAKICFECDQNVITGMTLNTTEFGQSGDYGKLYKILHR